MMLAAARVTPANNETALLSALIFFLWSGREPFPEPTNSWVQNRTNSSAMTTLLEFGVNASLAVTEWPGKISALPGYVSDLVNDQIVLFSSVVFSPVSISMFASKIDLFWLSYQNCALPMFPLPEKLMVFVTPPVGKEGKVDPIAKLKLEALLPVDPTVKVLS